MDLLSICIVHCARSVLTWQKHKLELFPRCIRSIGQASIESGVKAEIVIADWPQVKHEAPLAGWILDASVLPVRVLPMAGEFSKGRGCNAAALAAQSDLLFFCDADMIVPAEVLRCGVEYIAAGKIWFPGYLAEQGVGGSFKPPKTPGTGNAFMSREHWLKHGKWPEKTDWGNFDRPVSTRIENLGLSVEIVRERRIVPGFTHQWHPKFVGWNK